MEIILDDDENMTVNMVSVSMPKIVKKNISDLLSKLVVHLDVRLSYDDKVTEPIYLDSYHHEESDKPRFCVRGARKSN